jgi:hypothetical protein
MQRPTKPHNPARQHGARVAQPRSRFIPEGDALPSTHTNHADRSDWEVTYTITGRPPRPVAAINLPAVPIAVTMLLTVLAAAAFSVLQILGAHPARWVGVAAAIGVPALLGLVVAPLAITTRTASRPSRRSPGGRNV